ncbi:FmdB family zinc ribbon protein [Hydrogenophaga sp.]|uniref:FmdB family zinc ribbon protein n=1 Tax=Hydrogenophaga sp. TaxID=1904254 RepID=UPI00199101EA|nr:FmdB family zinc ribbon protein [Hydrogenophaga sp.]MBD3893943.1 zinc ribbon domain-containing protein [Hydrogenophaga sp.]
MPIYAYACESCGHAKDVLQKLSDAALSVCPACGQPSFKKQLTAAGFQLKGSGWYVTDFRDGNKPAASSPGAADAAATPAAAQAACAPAAADAAASSTAKSSPAPAASGPAPSA